MIDTLLANYDLLRALHLISVIAWLAGLFYLPRLFAYHTRVAVGSDQDRMFQVMERKLLRVIMNPAMIAAWLFGLLMLLANPVLFEFPWMHVKLTGIVLMTGFHHAVGIWRKRFAAGTNTRSERYYRAWNEAPTILMIVIVIMAVVEPF